MNENVKKAAFEFESYKVLKFSFDDPTSEPSKLEIKFNPSGTYIKSQGRFLLTFEFIAGFDEGQHVFVNTVFQGSFKFAENTLLEDIPAYFYRNSIAIVFPYVRSFVTTLTAISNVKPIILPVLNLSGLEQPLKDATTVIE